MAAVRPDIQALRGLAVLSVVLYHARLNLLPAGFLGVDIFFVISGFLITGIVRKGMERGSFSFREFYFRRAKRLLPAAYTTFALTSIASIALLTATELRQFADSLAGAVTFTANVVLMRQGSYFGGDADLKPLLHTWSLSIEEQYYMILPALMLFIPRRWWRPSILLVIAGSFAACLIIGWYKPSIAFYLIVTRGWELGIGSLGAFIADSRRSQDIARRLFWPALVGLVGLPFVLIGGFHPGFQALLACCATLCVILANHPLQQARIVRPLAWVGDISYSLYLVHWPLFAMFANIYLGGAPLALRLVLIPASILLAFAQYRWIENPIRMMPIGFSWRRVGIAVAGSLATIAIPYAAIMAGAAPERFVTERRGNIGLGGQCIFDKEFKPSARCVAGAAPASAGPTVLLWGDSYAMHLMPGIATTRGDERVMQATKYVCGPLIGTAPVMDTTGAEQNFRWAKGCLSFNDSVLEYLRRTPSIHTVILSSVMKRYTDAEESHVAVRNGDGQVVERPASVEEGLRGLAATVRAVRAMGRKIVFIAPPPALDWDAGLCAERRLRGLPTGGAVAGCTVTEAEYRAKRARVLDLLARAPAEAGLPVIMLDPALRVNGAYPAVVDGRILYIANGHLSYAGSEYVGRRMNLGTRAVAAAR